MIADRKSMERRRQRLGEAQTEWQKKAELALTKDREDLARAALVEKAKLVEDLKGLDEELVHLDEALVKYEEDIAKLEAKLREAKTKQKAIVARQTTAARASGCAARCTTGGSTTPLCASSRWSGGSTTSRARSRRSISAAARRWPKRSTSWSPTARSTRSSRR